MAQKPRTTVERGYGALHKTMRRRLLPLAYGKPCPFCGYPMLRDQYLDLDHTIPLVLGGGGGWRISHRSCNRSAGIRLRNSLRGQARLRTTRNW